jgi:hypothetical protein
MVDNCNVIAKEHGSEGDFVKWNPAVGSGCRGVWVKTYVCVGLL